MWGLGLLSPETYAPVLLRKRAAELTKKTGLVHRSMYDLHPMFSAPLATKMKAALLRPFVLLFKEAIVLAFSIYAAFIYVSLVVLCASTVSGSPSAAHAPLPSSASSRGPLQHLADARAHSCRAFCTSSSARTR